MGSKVNTERVYINGKDIIDYGAKALRDYVIGGTPIDNDYFQGRNRSHYTLMSTTYGMKTINITIVYFDETMRKASLNRSRLEAEMFNGFELYMPDGFYYRSILESIGEAETKGADGEGVAIEVKYKFLGIQHDPLVTIPDGTSFIAEGTLPKMDCRLSVTVGADADNYTLGGATFNNVHQGDVLVVDGIYKRFLKNGAPATATGWTGFPSVTMGQNAFLARDTVKVEFYPCYI